MIQTIIFNFLRTNKQLLVVLSILFCFISFWMARVEDFYNISRAFGLMASGFFILAGIFYLTNGDWNGYSDWKKIKVASSLFLVLSTLLVTVPESSKLLQYFGIVLDAEGEGRLGFILLGVALAKIVQSAINSQSMRANNVCTKCGQRISE